MQWAEPFIQVQYPRLMLADRLKTDRSHRYKSPSTLALTRFLFRFVLSNQRTGSADISPKLCYCHFKAELHVNLPCPSTRPSKSTPQPSWQTGCLHSGLGTLGPQISIQSPTAHKYRTTVFLSLCGKSFHDPFCRKIPAKDPSSRRADLLTSDKGL